MPTKVENYHAKVRTDANTLLLKSEDELQTNAVVLTSKKKRKKQLKD